METVYKMSAGWSWVLNALYIPLSICSIGVSGGLVQPCGHIIPESPVLTLGSNFTALCILNESCLDLGNMHANQIIWKIKNSVVPKEQYRVINRTVSSVTFNDTSTLATPLMCNILADGQIEQNIYGIPVLLGLPPQKPENLSCIVHQMSKNKFVMTCTWNPGRETFLDTYFYLKSQWPRETLDDCIPPPGVNNSCIIFNVQFFVNLEVWVEAKNALGKAESEHIIFDPVDIVKPLPPHNIMVSSGELPTGLKLSWENQVTAVEMELKFNIRYRISDSPEWMEIPHEDTATHRNSFTVQSLRPYTEYVFSLRCMKKDGMGYWSDWSEEKSGVTAEAKPSKGPPLWRKFGTSYSPNSWTVHLMWKELDRSEANGIILRYEVTVRTRPPLSRQPEKYSVNSTSLTLNLTNGTHDVTLTAYNRIGGSPPSFLLIPATNSKAAVKDLKAFPKDGKLWVEWTAPKNVVKYIIEWCMLSDASNCTKEWQQEPDTSQGTFLKGDIKPLKCYMVTVHPLYTNGQGNGQSTKAYLQQSVPAKGPTVQTQKVGKTEAVLVWKPLTVDEQNGFIRYYTILYRTISGNETVVRVDPSKTEYTLSSLSSDTLYSVKMEAYTDEGGTSGPVFTFTTQKFGKGEIEAIVVPVCLAFLLTVLLGVLFCFNKRDLIKKHIWPNVPDPSKSNIAQWSPQTPAKHNFSSKDQMYPEGNFTDVSVVEIEADDKKSFSEQDLKHFNFPKKEKNISEGHSSGIGGSSGMSSLRQSVSDSDENETTQNTSSTVQYSTVILNGYRDQLPSVQVFSRSESTQPLLDSEEKSEDNAEGCDSGTPRQQYFKQNCSQDETNTDGSRFERAKQVTPPVNEEDFVGLAQVQMSAQSSQQHGCGPEKNKHESALVNVLSPSTEGQILRLETAGVNTATVDDIPKSYMPQTVRPGGYMPQ
ncbi:interleukin-6 receptor subunit beta isoform X2 [Carettochelys insculpta]|uniref:interleukin-6 receptor subunit beta isoform X2 n=1 Tax=Carettochelys insculpta TaxID=44489 RepID=UPI003EBC84BD